MSAPTLNGLECAKVSLTIPWRGRWTAEIELASSTGAPTSGRATLIVGGMTLLGTVDTHESSSWVAKAWVKVIGGFGGWGKSVTQPLQFNDPASGLLSTQVYAATAQAVGEPPPNDPSPQAFGQNEIRMAAGTGAASIFDDRDWYVDLTTGVAQVTAWPSATLDPSAVIVNWNGLEQRALLNSDALVLPGTTLTDERFNGPSYIVRSVEQVYTQDGSIVIADCSPNATDRLQDALTLFIRRAVDSAHLKLYRYRYVMGQGNNLALQAITPGAPDLNPIAQWNGLNGGTTTFAPSTEIVVGFVADTPATPILVSFSPLTVPLTNTIDAQQSLTLGSQAPVVNVGGSSAMVAIAGGENALTPAPWATALAAALTIFATAASTATTAAQIATAAGTLLTALGALPPDATTNTTAT